MKNFISLCILLLFIGSCEKQTFLEDELPSEGKELLDLAIEEKAFKGITAAYASADSTWMYSAGYANEKALDLFSTNTLTRLASIAKPMTAIAILQLVEAGQLNLDNPIQDYLPEFPIKPEGTITTRHLLNHSSGIAAYKNENEVENQIEYESLADAIDIFKNRDLLATPGTDLNYSTYGYVVLGRIIEMVSGKDYETYMQDNIWEVAGMVNTRLEHVNQTYTQKSELYHREDNGKIKVATANNLSNRHPGGGIISTLEDMLKFGKAILNNDLITKASLDLMFEFPDIKNEGLPYGLGWRKYNTDPSLGAVYGHEGAQTGASTVFMIYPEEDFFVVILTNTSGALDEVFKIAARLFEINHG